MKVGVTPVTAPAFGQIFGRLFAICTTAHGAVAAPGTVPAMGLLAMLSLGLIGSIAHCGAMCGPLVMGQSAGRLARIPCTRMRERDRLSAGILLPYHLGRMSTYVGLGAVAGGMGFGLAAMLHPLRSALLVAAAVALIWVALGRGAPWGGAAAAPWRGTARGPGGNGLAGGGAPAWFRRLLTRVQPGGYAFGLVLGLLPCGLLYTALLAACATGSPLWGAASMAAFGAGTVPILVFMGVAGQARALRGWLQRAAPVVLIFDAGVLLLAALGGVLV